MEVSKLTFFQKINNLLIKFIASIMHLCFFATMAFILISLWLSIQMMLCSRNESKNVLTTGKDLSVALRLPNFADDLAESVILNTVSLLKQSICNAQKNIQQCFELKPKKNAINQKEIVYPSITPESCNFNANKQLSSSVTMIMPPTIEDPGDSITNVVDLDTIILQEKLSEDSFDSSHQSYLYKNENQIKFKIEDDEPDFLDRCQKTNPWTVNADRDLITNLESKFNSTTEAINELYSSYFNIRPSSHTTSKTESSCNFKMKSNSGTANHSQPFVNYPTHNENQTMSFTPAKFHNVDVSRWLISHQCNLSPYVQNHVNKNTCLPYGTCESKQKKSCKSKQANSISQSKLQGIKINAKYNDPNENNANFSKLKTAQRKKSTKCAQHTDYSCGPSILKCHHSKSIKKNVHWANDLTKIIYFKEDEASKLMFNRSYWKQIVEMPSFHFPLFSYKRCYNY